MDTEGAIDYLLFQNGNYYFNRRVPAELSEFDARKNVRFSLKTDSWKEAKRLATLHNSHLESYWKELVQTGKKHVHSAYEAVVKRARLLGFGYMPNAELANASVNEFLTRLFHVRDESLNVHHVSAVLGGVPQPQIKLDDALAKYWEYSTEIILSKSPNQLRKWKRPRERAIENLINVIGNKPIVEITRNDILLFKDWWLNKINEDDLGKNGANKNFSQIKVILEIVSDNLSLNLDIENLFRKIFLREDDETRRLPFTTDYLTRVLLNPENLAGLNEQAKWAFYAFAETGAGLSELVGLSHEDIILNNTIPHIIIRPKHKKKLKTKYRKRILPITGHALEAFKALPHGFTDYHDRPDTLSSVINKYLRENNLFPSDQHSVYSLRHSFQDRLLAANAPDRVQADLMGHKFERPNYGDGASLQQKLEWLKKIQLKLE